MVMNNLKYLLIPLYLVGWLGTAGAINADFRHEFRELDQNRIDARKDFAFALAWSALPIVSWILAPVFTGGYASGWTLESKPLPCTETDDIGKNI